MTETVIGDLYQVANAGGIKRLLLVPRTDVVGILPAVDMELAPGSVLLATTADLTDLRFAQNSCDFVQDMAESEAGVSCNVRINCDIPKQQATVLNWYAQRLEREFLAMAQDYNGTWFLAGDPETLGLRLSAVMGTGSRPADKNLTRFQLTGQMWHPCYILQEFDLSILTGNFDFSTEFDLSFNA